MENNYVLLQNTDNNNNKQAHKPLQLALALSTPSRNEIDVARCPTVYEDGHYQVYLQIRLSELETALNKTNSDNQSQDERIKSDRPSGTDLAKQDLYGFTKSQNDEETKQDVWSKVYDRETESLYLTKVSNYQSSYLTPYKYLNQVRDANTKTAPKVTFVRSRFNTRPEWKEQQDQRGLRLKRRGIQVVDVDIHADEADDDDPFKLLNDNNVSALRLFDDQFKRLTSITVELNQQRIGSCKIESQGSGNYSATVEFDQRNGMVSNQPFLLQYDVVVLSFTLTFEDGYTLPVYGPPLLCASLNSNETENINQILFELTNLENNRLLDIMFKQGQMTIRKVTKDDWMNFEENRSYQSLSEYSFLVEQIVQCYTKNFSYFKTQAKHSLIKCQTVVPFNQVKKVSSKNFNWLTQHLEVLNEVDPYVAVLNYQDKSYQPLQMQTDTLRKSFSTYENNVVTSFLHMVLHNANKIANEYQSFIEFQREQLNQGTHLSHGSYLAPIITMKLIQLEHCAQELDKLHENIKLLSNLYLNYQKIFKIPAKLLKTFPRTTKIFQEIKPYAEIFRNIWSFFQFGSFHLDKDRMLFEVTTLDRLFEYYCLYRLLEMLMQNGFKPIPNGNRIFEYGILKQSTLQQVNNNAVANTYILRRGSQQAILYYQPVIYSRCFENGIMAYRTTQTNSPRSALYGDFYTPDFILKFSNSEQERDQAEYVIFDAKFAQTNTILQYYIDELTRKYAFETAIAIVEPYQKSLKTEQKSSKEYESFEELLNEQERQEQAQASNAATTSTSDASGATSATTKAQGEPEIKTKTVLTLRGKVITIVEDDNTHVEDEDKGDLICHQSKNEYIFAGSKPPRMIFALQGRLNIKTDSTQQSFATATADKRFNKSYYEDKKGKRYTGVRMKSLRNMLLVHNSDIARQCPPPTTIGLVEFNTQINSTPALWHEIIRNISFLRNDPRTAEEIREDEELIQANLQAEQLNAELNAELRQQ